MTVSLWILLLLVMVLLITYYAKAVRWSGEFSSFNGVEYEYEIMRSKRKPTGLRIGVKLGADCNFLLKHESWIDKLAKFVGLSWEHQVGCDEFDKAVYIVSDSKVVCRDFLENQKIKSISLALLTLDKQSVKAKQICAEKNRIWVEFVVPSDFCEGRVSSFESEVVPALKQLSDGLEKLETGDSSFADPFYYRAILLLTTVAVLALCGLVRYMWVFWSTVPFLLDKRIIIVDTVIMGIIALTLLMVATVILLGRTSRAHLVLIQVLMVGALGIFPNAAAELKEVNIKLDKSNVKLYSTVLLKKERSGRRKYRKYYFYLDDWTGEKKHRKIRVSNSEYNSFNPGQIFNLEQQDGFLGYRWVSKMIVGDSI